MHTTYPAHQHRGLFLLVASFIVLATGAVAVTFGSVAIPLETLWQIIAAKIPGMTIAPTWSPSWETIVFDIRLPRIALAALVGSALATSGATYQGLLRNPLADPYLIGVSAGAALGATIAIVFSFGAISLFAFVGAIGATMLIYALARAGGRTTPTTLILAGVALGAFLSAITSFLMFQGDSAFRTHQVIAWMMGSFSLSSWQDVAVMIAVPGNRLAGAVFERAHAECVAVGRCAGAATWRASRTRDDDLSSRQHRSLRRRRSRRAASLALSA